MWSIAIRQVLLWTVLCGLVYPLLITALSQPLHIKVATTGQAFSKPGEFWSRPSAVAYNAASSSGTNFGPHEPKREEQTTLTADAPPDLRYASGSGLDPDITPEAAYYQVPRVAAARKLAPARVEELVKSQVRGKTFGILGHERVNVADLNRALDGL